MSHKNGSSSHDRRSRRRAERLTVEENAASRWLRWLMEAVTLCMIVGSPWALGCADPPFELYLQIGVGVLGVLWALRMLVQKKLLWQPSGVSFCLLILFALGLYQLVPLPAGVLRALSPASAELIEDLRPKTPEELPYDLKLNEALPSASHTLSVYPAATRYAIFRLLAVLVLFEAVRNVCATSASFKRLSVCAFLNSVALSFVAIFQFVSSSPYEMYWSFTFPSKIFGTFVCRNHFPFYVNIGLGLGLGLFFAAMEASPAAISSRTRSLRGSRTSGYSRSDLQSPYPTSLLGKISDWIHALLSNPTALWISAGISIIVCADFLSMSRGGVLALVFAVAACLVYKSITSSHRALSAGLIVMFVLALGLVNWLGWNLVEARFSTLLSKDALSNRAPMWRDGLGAFYDAPIFGTGYGTFQYVEPVHRRSAEDSLYFFDHAHNDYLEAAVEGGLIRLIAALVAIVLVYAAGWRAMRRLAGTSEAQLLLGGLVGFTTVVIHSFGEFGLFTPAITVLVAVLVAQIVASDIWSTHTAPVSASATRNPEPYSLRLGGLAPVGGLVLAVIIGATLVMEGWRADRQCRFRNAAERLQGGDAADSERSITYLQEALRWGADSAWTQQELGDFYMNVYQSKVDALDLFGSTQVIFGILTPLLRGGPTALQASAIDVASEPLILSELVPKREAEIEKMYLAPALRCFVQARNLCPLLARAQLRLVALGPKLSKGSSQSEYLERAKLVAGYDPEFWFMGGAVALAEKRPDECWPCWKASLAISKRFYKEILNQSRRHLTPSEILENVLPDNPELIVETANILLPNPTSQVDKEARAAYFQRAVPLLRNQTREITAEGWLARASVYQELNQDNNAVAALRMAMSKEPDKLQAARLELVRILIRMGDRAQARRELDGILTQEPWNNEAKRLSQELSGSKP